MNGEMSLLSSKWFEINLIRTTNLGPTLVSIHFEVCIHFASYHCGIYVDGSQLAKMKQYILYMSLLENW